MTDSTPHAYCSDPEQHKSLVKDVADRRVRICIPPNVACRFYLWVSLAEIKDKTGVNEAAPKLLVFVSLIGAFLLLAGTIGLTIVKLGWASVIYVPVGGIVWSIFAGFINTSNEIRHITWILGGFVLVSSITSLLHANSYLLDILALYIVSLWLHRIAYAGATLAIKRFVLRSCMAFEMLSEHIDVQST